MKKVLERLLGTVVAVDDEDEEETEQPDAHIHKSVHCSLDTLRDWYMANTKVGAESIGHCAYAYIFR